MTIKTQNKVLSSFYWLVELMEQILRGERLAIRTVLMLSSRWSGKTHQVELVLIILLIQNRVCVVMYYVRARNKNTEEAQDGMTEMAHGMTGGVGVFSNKTTRTIKFGKNKIIFDTLNEEKEKVNKTGGKIGKPIEKQAQYMVVFYEECSQLNEQLVENHRQSIKGNINTQQLFIYASNPWKRDHWFVEQFLKGLPETKANEHELLAQGYNMNFDSKTKTLYYRPRYTLNDFVPKDVADEMERLKDYNYNKWRIVSLGFTGNLNGAIYEAALEKLNQNVEKHPLTHTYIGGVDWGDGKTSGGSPTVALIGGLSYENGIDLYGEFQHHNGKGRYLTTQKQQELICKFYIEWYEKLQKPITVYVDNAALGDFYQMFNTILASMGYAGKIEFLPAFKPKNTWERVETINNLMTLGILRYNKKTCPRLYESMENCYEVVKDTVREGSKRERSHEWTHALHALEYLIGRNIKDFQQQIPEVLQNSKSLDKYGIF